MQNLCADSRTVLTCAHCGGGFYLRMRIRWFLRVGLAIISEPIETCQFDGFL